MANSIDYYSILFLIIIIIALFLLMTTFIINGVKLLRNEGAVVSHLFTLLFGIGLILYVFIWPIVVDITQSHILNTLYQWIIFTGSYLSLLLIFYALSNWLNLIHFKKEKIDYFIILGAGLLGKEVTPLLAGRINKGLEERNVQVPYLDRKYPLNQHSVHRCILQYLNKKPHLYPISLMKGGVVKEGELVLTSIQILVMMDRLII